MSETEQTFVEEKHGGRGREVGGIAEGQDGRTTKFDNQNILIQQIMQPRSESLSGQTHLNEFFPKISIDDIQSHFPSHTTNNRALNRFTDQPVHLVEQEESLPQLGYVSHMLDIKSLDGKNDEDSPRVPSGFFGALNPTPLPARKSEIANHFDGAN